ncbi:hypothetical protein Zmor_009370 [Zophobas morio]|uniref:Uncharacterized protein n=1 Tax=Zophobas morio TaxID=2755281 RepID=A0AA38INV4_9CUCU|nr:hypothetical protein Zmor_009370 [Zophobas morio]
MRKNVPLDVCTAAVPFLPRRKMWNSTAILLSRSSRVFRKSIPSPNRHGSPQLLHNYDKTQKCCMLLHNTSFTCRIPRYLFNRRAVSDEMQLQDRLLQDRSSFEARLHSSLIQYYDTASLLVISTTNCARSVYVDGFITISRRHYCRYRCLI